MNRFLNSNKKSKFICDVRVVNGTLLVVVVVVDKDVVVSGNVVVVVVLVGTTSGVITLYKKIIGTKDIRNKVKNRMYLRGGSHEKSIFSVERLLRNIMRSKM
jgi:hypothetical protein